MILRKLSQSMKEQNWTAIWIEFLLLVAGVFLGIQVANWNEQRSEREAEIGYLYKLESDIDSSIENVQISIARLNNMQDTRKKLYEYSIFPDQELPRVELDSLLREGLYSSVGLSVRQVTFDSLKNSGHLDLLKSDDLVVSLLQLNELIAEDSRVQNDETQIMYLFSDPLLVENFEMGRIFKQPRFSGPEKTISWLSQVRPEEPMPSIMRTAKFSNVVLYRTAITENRLRGIQEILSQYKKTKVLIIARKSKLEGEK